MHITSSQKGNTVQNYHLMHTHSLKGSEEAKEHGFPKRNGTSCILSQGRDFLKCNKNWSGRSHLGFISSILECIRMTRLTKTNYSITILQWQHIQSIMYESTSQASFFRDGYRPKGQRLQSKKAAHLKKPCRVSSAF